MDELIPCLQCGAPAQITERFLLGSTAGPVEHLKTGGAVMDLLLGAVGMLVCLAIMAAVMPLGMRVARRLRRGPISHTPDSTTSGSQDPSGHR
jgi:hypothetical protein